ncbi:MAG: ABC transporter ATP-binding protein [Candidatus Omnitrophota bacterium]|jgi:ABC-2 type transport system ATP-binding protein
MAAVLKVENLTVAYRQGLNKEKVAIDDISLDIEKGKILGLLGPNGAGKTTLIKTIMGLIAAKRGTVLTFGKPFTTAMKRHVGYMPEIANFYWFLTPKEILSMLGALSGLSRKDVAERSGIVLDKVGLSGEENQLVKNFSKGMSERLNLAQAILHDPQLMILDEPFSGLDPLGRIQMRNILSSLKKEGKTILLSSHELSEAELVSDDICVMKNGKLLKCGPLAKILEGRADRSLENYFLQMIGG